ncbi:MAG TPA: hypothetical protein PLW15_06385, partial [Rhodoglobus sp.]|nr:hypothetical protein [Rhodoglobus sp.]
MANAGVRGILGVTAIGLAVVLMAGCTAPPPVLRLASGAIARPVDPIVLYADARLSVMTLDEKIESMLMVHVPGLDVGALEAFASE